MSKRITLERARELKKNELESKKDGYKPKVSRAEKRRRMRMSKTERFIERLKNRGGYKYCDICRTSLDKCRCPKK